MNEENLIRDSDTIYFVCSGNIIRSSFAELYAKHIGVLNTASYGTTYPNTKIHQRSATKLREIGVDENLISGFSPTHIDELDDFSKKDIHIVMTSDHKSQLLDRGIKDENIILISTLAGRTGDVADPYFSDNYKEAYSTISQAVNRINDIIA